MNNRQYTDPSAVELLGYPISTKAKAPLCIEIAAWAREGDSFRWLACINPHSYCVARADAAFSGALRSASWLIPDGAGIVLASRILNGSVEHRVTGSDIFFLVNAQLNATGGARLFLLGSTPDNLEKMRRLIAHDYPNLEVVGCHAPPFRAEFSSEDDELMVAAINASGADVLWVGLSSPKQDLWLHRNESRLQVRFAAGVGAVFDFYTGAVKRPSEFAQSLKIEWLVRLLRDYRRLWRRTLVSAPGFLWCVAKAKVQSAYRSGTMGVLS